MKPLYKSMLICIGSSIGIWLSLMAGIFLIFPADSGDMIGYTLFYITPISLIIGGILGFSIFNSDKPCN